jgi:hypothetical protein
MVEKSIREVPAMTEQPNPSLYGEEPAPAAEKVKAPGLLDQVIGVFTEPVALFQKLNKAPSWAWAAGATVVMAILVTVVWGLKVDADAMIRPILEANPKVDPGQYDMIIGMQKKFLIPFGVLGSLFGVPVVVAIIAFIYWLVGKATAEGPQPSYLQAMSAAAVPGLVMLPHSLAVLVMCFAREVGGATPDKLSPTSLGYFLHPENPKLFALLNFVDPFAIASFVLTWLATRHILGLKASGATICTILVAGAGIGMRVMGAR